ncbi:MAG: DUF4139 domain-containing protein [Armatimonadetes bacterium]|nr:DUF4139 domain-containing protein [Armatimonadota bacterium]
MGLDRREPRHDADQEGPGTETQLRVSRELKAKQTEIKGGNKVISYTYEMRLQNFREKPAKVRLWDRVPQPPDKQVTVTMQEPGQPLSTDAWYTEQEKPRGLLRWDLEVPAKAVRTTALAFTYKFQLEFDKNFSIGELPPEAVERLKRDFEMMKPGGMGGGFGGAAQP